MIPGANLFNLATKLIRPQLIQYLKFDARTQNAVKQWVSTFQDPVDIWASVQAVNTQNYKLLELDFKKDYVKIFVAESVTSLDRDSSGDRFFINGGLFQMIDDTNWFVQDGWMSAVAVRLGPASGVIN